MSQEAAEVTETDVPVTRGSNEPWLRLSVRMIWVDLAQTVLSLSPLLVALFVFQIESNLWPLGILAALGVWGALQDAIRWVFTRYRITDDYVELRTGIVTRSYRSVKRDRIRSVDIEAKLRHRVAGLRVINIGAGQQAASGESAFTIDAVVKADAEGLRHLLLRRHVVRGDAEAKTADDGDVYARLNSWWVVYNMFSIWSYVMAAGLLWGGYWLVSSFGFGVDEWVAGLLDWEQLALGWWIVLSIAAIGLFGSIAMGINFFTEYWRFELARVPGEKGTSLRTRQGLFTTREINRDDNRMRGLTISEPLLWRWMRMADTNLITTGLSVWSMSQPTAVLPRGPRSMAWRVAPKVLKLPGNVFATQLRQHPAAALRRRLAWATVVAAGVASILGWLSYHEIIPAIYVWTAAGVWIIGLLAAVIAYRALGHAVNDDYLIVRSGLISRSTSALQRSAVSTIAIRQSPLQWRLGLKTVSAMTAAGWAVYEAVDIDATEATNFANEAAPGLLTPFILDDEE